MGRTMMQNRQPRGILLKTPAARRHRRPTAIETTETCMSFSKRVGQEPASDLKSRIQTLCQEAGFEVLDAQTHLVREDTMQESARIIHVWIHEPGWKKGVPAPYAGTDWEEHANHQIAIRAMIGVDGTFGGNVLVLCSATDMAG